MRYHPNNRGFDEFAGFLNGGMNYWNWIIEYNGQPKWSDGRYLTDVFTQDAIQFIKRHKTQPFFLYVAYNAPHGPLEAPEEDIQPFEEMEKFTRAVCLTYGMIRRMDTGIGQILDTLEQHGLAEDTIVLYTSDNGPTYLGKGGKRPDALQRTVSGNEIRCTRRRNPRTGPDPLARGLAAGQDL